TIARFDAELRAALGAFLEECGALIAPDPRARPKKRRDMYEQIHEALTRLAHTLGEPARDARDLSRMARHVDAALESAQLERLHDWARARFNGTEADRFGESAPTVARRAEALHETFARFVRLDPLLERAARTVLARLLAELRARLVAAGVESFGDLLRDA